MVPVGWRSVMECRVFRFGRMMLGLLRRGLFGPESERLEEKFIGCSPQRGLDRLRVGGGTGMKVKRR